MATTDGLVAACGPPPDASKVCEAVYRVTGNTFLAQSSDTLIVTPLRVLLILALAFACSRIARRVIRRAVRGLEGLRPPATTIVHIDGNADPVGAARRAQRAKTIGSLLDSIATFVIWIIAALMVLGELHINIGPLIAGAGIVGIAFGFGAQNLVRDVISGFFLILEDQVRIGDLARINGVAGIVEQINLRTIVVRDGEGAVQVFPNGTITALANLSKQFSYAIVDVRAAYSENIDRVIGTMREVGASMERDAVWAPLLMAPLDVVGVESLDGGAVTVRVRFKVLPLHQGKVANELRKRLIGALVGRGIRPYAT